MPRSLIPLCIGFLLLTPVACGDDQQSPDANTEPDVGPEIVEVRCQGSDECPEGQVCRSGICRAAPECDAITDCELGENCIDELCAYDPEVCTADTDCDREAGEICLADTGACRVGCRSDGDCEEVELCTEDLECERRPCPEAPCDEGYECDEVTGVCDLKACNGGCEEPLQCRVVDDTCVECFLDEECEIGEICDDEGLCAPLPCEEHDDCPEGTFCILNFCELPPACDDDDLEDDDEYGTGELLSEGTHTGLISCPYDDDFHQIVADGNHSLTVEAHFDHEVGNIDLELLNTVGVTFARRASENDDEELTVNISKTGLYTVRIFQEAGTQGVPYELLIDPGGQPVPVAPDLCLVDGFEPNETPETATPIFTGRWTGPSICAGDEDYYTMFADAGEFLKVCLTPSEIFGVSLGLELLDSGGGEVASGAGMTEFCLEDDLVAGDDWLFHVFGLQPEAEATYHLELFVEGGCRLFDDAYDQAGLNNLLPAIDGACPAEPACDEGLTCVRGRCMVVLDPETDHELQVCPSSPDYWPVPLLRRDQLSATITFEHDDGDIQMRLRRPNSTILVGSTGTSDVEAINWEAEQDGVHFLEVYGEAGDQGPYTFNYSVDPFCQADDYEDNDTPGSAASITPSESDETTLITGLWRCDEDDDYFTFEVPADPAPGQVVFQIQYIDEDGTLELEVIDDDGGGQPLTTDVSVDGIRTVTVDTDILAGNAYQIQVTGEDNVQNTYDLTVTVTPE